VVFISLSFAVGRYRIDRVGVILCEILDGLQSLPKKFF